YACPSAPRNPVGSGFERACRRQYPLHPDVGTREPRSRHRQGCVDRRSAAEEYAVGAIVAEPAHDPATTAGNSTQASPLSSRSTTARLPIGAEELACGKRAHSAIRPRRNARNSCVVVANGPNLVTVNVLKYKADFLIHRVVFQN